MITATTPSGTRIFRISISARKRPALDLLANRIIERRHDLDALGHRLHPLRRKRQPVPKRLSQNRGALISKVRRIRLEHLTRPLPQAAPQAAPSSILHLSRGARKRRRGSLRALKRVLTVRPWSPSHLEGYR